MSAQDEYNVQESMFGCVLGRTDASELGNREATLAGLPKWISLTLSRLGVPLVHHLALFICISPNYGPIGLIPSEEMIIHTLAIHFAL
jgi:hypothetical protein